MATDPDFKLDQKLSNKNGLKTIRGIGKNIAGKIPRKPKEIEYFRSYETDADPIAGTTMQMPTFH